MEYSDQSSLLFRDQKEFYVTAPEADSHFIKRNFDPNLGLPLVGYLPQFFEGTNSIRKMSEDLIGDGTRGRHFAISAYMADDHTMIRLSVNPDQYPVEQLVSRIRTAPWSKSTIRFWR